MKYKMKLKSTLPKSSSESKKLKLKSKVSNPQSKNLQAISSPSPTPLTKNLTNNPFEVANTNEPRTVKIDDLLRPRVEEVKRKRGRPSLASKQSTNSSTSNGANLQSSASHSGNSSFSPLQPVIAPSAIKPLLKMPFTTVAQWTDIPEINLTEKEADDLVPSLEIVMRQYSSQMNSPHAALIAFSISIGIISVQKMFIYKAEMDKRKKIADEIARQNGVTQ